MTRRVLVDAYLNAASLRAGIESLSLPPDFAWIGPAACERCLQLQQVDLSSTEGTEIMGSAFCTL